MTTWSKEPPKEPGWYWLKDAGYGDALVAHLNDKGRWRLPGTAYPYQCLLDDYEFGPRIPSPEAIEAIEAAKDALRDAALSLDARTGKIQHEVAAACRAALAKLEARS